MYPHWPHIWWSNNQCCFKHDCSYIIRIFGFKVQLSIRTIRAEQQQSNVKSVIINMHVIINGETWQVGNIEHAVLLINALLTCTNTKTNDKGTKWAYFVLCVDQVLRKCLILSYLGSPNQQNWIYVFHSSAASQFLPLYWSFFHDPNCAGYVGKTSTFMLNKTEFSFLLEMSLSSLYSSCLSKFYW